MTDYGFANSELHTVSKAFKKKPKEKELPTQEAGAGVEEPKPKQDGPKDPFLGMNQLTANMEKIKLPKPTKVSKRDWKNISQRETDARNGRRGKKQGAQVAGAGATVTGAGVAIGGDKIVHAVGKIGRKTYKTDRLMGEHALGAETIKGTSRKASALRAVGQTAAHLPYLSSRDKLGAAAVTGGVALAAAGGAKYAHGLGKERHAERKIKLMRKQRSGISKSVFGVEHPEAIEKAFGMGKLGQALHNSGMKTMKAALKPKPEKNFKAQVGAAKFQAGQKIKSVDRALSSPTAKKVGVGASVTAGATGGYLAANKPKLPKKPSTNNWK